MTARMPMRLNNPTERTSHDSGRETQAPRAAIRPGTSPQRSADDRHDKPAGGGVERSNARHAPRKPDSERIEHGRAERSDRRAGAGRERPATGTGDTDENSRRKSASIRLATRSVIDMGDDGIEMPSSDRMLGFLMSRGLLVIRHQFRMQLSDRLAVRPADIPIFAGDNSRHPGLRTTDAPSQIRLRKATSADFGYEFLPVHNPIIRIMFPQVNSNMFKHEITMLL